MNDSVKVVFSILNLTKKCLFFALKVVFFFLLFLSYLLVREIDKMQGAYPRKFDFELEIMEFFLES